MFGSKTRRLAKRVQDLEHLNQSRVAEIRELKNELRAFTDAVGEKLGVKFELVCWTTYRIKTEAKGGK